MQPEYLAGMLDINQYEKLTKRFVGLRVTIAATDKRHQSRDFYLKGLRAMRTSIDNAIEEIVRDGVQLRVGDL